MSLYPAELEVIVIGKGFEAEARVPLTFESVTAEPFSFASILIAFRIFDVRFGHLNSLNERTFSGFFHSRARPVVLHVVVDDQLQQRYQAILVEDRVSLFCQEPNQDSSILDTHEQRDHI